MENKENKFTPELIEKARHAKSIEELLALAEENGITLTEDEAKAYFAQLHKSGELSDDELDSVAGGGCGGGQNIDPSRARLPCHTCEFFHCRICNNADSSKEKHICLPQPLYPEFWACSICMNCMFYSEENSPFFGHGVCSNLASKKQ